MLSMCPSSVIFKAADGPADQVLHVLDTAQILGSSFVRCVVGFVHDSRGPVESSGASTTRWRC
jgi:hypothetical protein